MRLPLLLTAGFALALPWAAHADAPAASGTAAAAAPSASPSPTAKASPSASPTPAVKARPSATPTITSTLTPQPTPTLTASPTATPDDDANDDADNAADAEGPAATIAAGVSGTATGAYHLVKRVPLPGDKGWDYCLADGDARRLYVTHGDQVLVLSLDNGKVLGKVGGLLGVHGVALATDLGRGYVSDGKAGVVACFDLQSFAILASIPAKPGVDAIVYEPATQQVFAFSGDDRSCTIIDAPSNKVVATVDLDGQPEFAAVDNDTMVYVNLVDTDELVTLDAKIRAVVRRRPVAPGSKPCSLSYDADGNNLFIGCRNGQAVVMDAASGVTKAAFAIGDRVDASVYDPAQRLVFHSCGDGSVSILRKEADGGFSALPPLATKKGSRTMALDPKTHQLYLPAADFGAEPAPSEGQPHPRPAMAPGSFSLLIFGRD